MAENEVQTLGKGDICSFYRARVEEHESLESAELFKDLKIDRESKPVEPLLEGEWE